MNNIVGDPVPDNREEADAKKSGLMNKIRGVRVSILSLCMRCNAALMKISRRTT